jgi:hypothetical protein
MAVPTPKGGVRIESESGSRSFDEASGQAIPVMVLPKIERSRLELADLRPDKSTGHARKDLVSKQEKHRLAFLRKH